MTVGPDLQKAHNSFGKGSTFHKISSSYIVQEIASLMTTYVTVLTVPCWKQ